MTTDDKQWLAMSCLANVQYKEKDILLMAFGNEWIALCAKTGQILASPSSVSDTKAIHIPESLLPKDKIRAMCIHEESGLLALVADDKTLSCWSLDTFERVSQMQVLTCQKLIVSELLKRANSVCFSKDASQVLVADKFGDVYTCSTMKPTSLKLLLGHVSMLIDMIMSPDGQYVITADRDEKIRISHYPNTFNIESFCLGHSEFISCLHIPSFAPNILISGGGDSFLGVWDALQGNLLSSFDLSDYKLSIQDQPYSHVVKCICSSPFSKAVCVVLEGAPFVLLLQVSDSRIALKEKVDLDKDVLSACFDGQGHLWISYGTMQGQLPITKDIVGILSFDQESQQYSPPNNQHALLKDIQAVGTRKVSDVPDYYEVSKLGKEVIIQKFHKRDQNKKFQPKSKKNKESETKREALSEIEGETSKKIKATA